jgi:hypothetical protein
MTNPYTEMYINDWLYCNWMYNNQFDKQLAPRIIKYTPREPVLGYEDRYLPNLFGT